MMRYPFAGLCLLALFALLIPASSFANPDSDVPEHWGAHLLEHRAQEAQSKEAKAKKYLMVEAEKTANQELFDVLHYGLDLNLNPTSRILNGSVTVTALVTGSSLNAMDLNLKSNMAVSAVMAGGEPSTFIRSGNLLTVNLDRSYASGETVQLAVTYSGDPSGEAFGWDSHSGQHMIWTLSEPYGAREWWPCKDLNTDKADSLDIMVTVPSNLVVASQGLLQSDTTVGSLRTFHWKTNYPTVPYLVSLAIYPYTQYSDWYTPLDGSDPMEVQFFVYPDHFNSVQENYALTVPMIGAFAEAYGEYPFVDEKYGHAEFTWGGGMEHQTISSMGGWSEDLISHELGHQWWGDMVTCADFGHIWLNEGFATWGEAFWAEQAYGFSTYQEYMAIASYYGDGTIFVENPLSENIFDSNLSYNKGSWIVHMLRGVLGDEDFFAGLQQYSINHLYGSATTEELQAALEAVSGRDLTAFFQQWIYGEYFPVYEMSWTQVSGDADLVVTISQVQENAGVFTMPVPLRITTDQGTTDLKVENNQASQQFTITVNGTVESVRLDPENWILRQVKTTVTNAPLDEGVLLVNGVDWGTYSNELDYSYEARAFWGNTPITFWDTFNAPAGGYPSSLPTPLGHGAVPADVIGRYSTVIWVGNNYAGDLAKWAETPVRSYLEAGGNLLLMTRRSQDFLTDGLADYLDVNFAEWGSTLGNCVAAAPDLVNIPFVGAQSWNDVYSNVVGPQSTVLFRDTSGFSSTRITGLVTMPEGGGTFRPDGGRFALISGRPYRMEASALMANVEEILDTYLLEPYSPVVSGVEDEPALVPSIRAGLGSNYPNPFNPQTIIPFSLAQGGEINVEIFDARGRLVSRLAQGEFTAGRHELVWNGTDHSGRAVPSGVYFARLRDRQGLASTERMTLVR